MHRVNLETRAHKELQETGASPASLDSLAPRVQLERKEMPDNRERRAKMVSRVLLGQLETKVQVEIQVTPELLELLVNLDSLVLLDQWDP